MNYVQCINSLLPNKSREEVVLDLFSGAGGLALGFEAAGFKTIGMELDVDSTETYNHNLSGKSDLIKIMPSTTFPKADIIVGGPPCQPFSVGGNQKGNSDERDGFPSFIEAVRQVKPKVWIFENVRGVTYKNKHYINKVLLELEKLGYRISAGVLCAEDYGVPQKRHRFVAVGTRSTTPIGFPPNKMPNRHTVRDAIGDTYLDFDETSKFLTPSQDAYIARYEKASKCVKPRDLHLDQSSRTVTCRNLAGATGDMLRVKLEDGRRRRLTVREAARLQSFPDWYEFKGSESSIFKQIGNAVPPLLGYSLANHIKRYLENPDNNDFVIGSYLHGDVRQLELV